MVRIFSGSTFGLRPSVSRPVVYCCTSVIYVWQ